MIKRLSSATLAACVLACMILVADEGMWRLDQLPLKQIEQKYGVALTPEDIARVQGAVVRISTGGTGTFASADGLILTNHHVALDCIRTSTLAEQGQAGSQYQLGLLYANGQGVTKDDAKARQWYEKAAVQGHAEAQVNLGILLMYARGGQQDYKMAVYYLRLSANQGNDLAQRRLGQMYERGDGVPQDYVKAYMWYSLGAANGMEAGARLRDALAKRMDPDQIAEAQKLAREWKPKGK